MVESQVTITLHPREDGGLRVSSPSLPGLYLSGETSGVLASILPAVRALREHRKTAIKIGSGVFIGKTPGVVIDVDGDNFVVTYGNLVMQRIETFSFPRDALSTTAK